MGTRSLTRIYNEGSEELVTMYRQFDGYPEGLGKELAEFLSSHELVNGISGDSNSSNAFNGMGCLAARVVSHFKGDEIGSVYLYQPGATDCWEEFVYRIECDEGKIMLSVYGVYAKKDLFSGTPEEYLEWLGNKEED